MYLIDNQRRSYEDLTIVDVIKFCDPSIIRSIGPKTFEIMKDFLAILSTDSEKNGNGKIQIGMDLKDYDL